MGSDAKKAYGCSGRGEKLVFNYGDKSLVIIGLDVEDPGNVLNDPDRVAEGFDEGMVQDIVARSPDLTPILVRKNGTLADGVTPRVEVVYGRGRTMSIREAWGRMLKAGVAVKDLPTLSATSVSGASDAELLEMMLAENLQRREEGPLSAAHKAVRLLNLYAGMTPPTREDRKRVATVCHISVKTLGDWEAMVKLSPGAQKLIRAGKVGAHRVSAYAAVDLLRGIPVEEQEARLRSLAEQGKASGLAAELEARRGRAPAEESPADGAEVSETPVALPTRKAIRKFRGFFGKGGAASDTFTRTQVANLLDHFLDGKPLRGPLREAWVTATTKPAKKPARDAQVPG